MSDRLMAPGDARYVHLRLANGRFDTRLQKQAGAAMRTGLFSDVLVLAKIGPKDGALPLHEATQPGVELARVRVLRIFPGLNFAAWLLRTLVRSVRARPRVISAHHVDLLFIGVLAKLLTGARLVYDAHELETESATLTGHPVRKALAKIIERFLIPFCDQVIVVNEAIADWYRARHPRVPVAAIMNAPLRRPAPVCDGGLRAALSIPDDKTVFLYQGVLEYGRSVEFLLDIFRRGAVPDGVMVFMGFGGLEVAIREAAAQSPHVRFHPAVPPERIVEAAAGADCGVALIEPICLSYQLALPNKLFDYMAAGLPQVVSSASTLMASMVERHGLGFVVDPDPAAAAAVLRAICTTDLAPYRAAALSAAETFCWENEEPKLQAIYRRLMTTPA